MKILVLGGAGYIGSHTVYRLIEQGHSVVVFDNLETGHIEAVHPDAKFYKGDLRNREDIDKLNEQHQQEMKEVTTALNNNTLALQKLSDVIGNGGSE